MKKFFVFLSLIFVLGTSCFAINAGSRFKFAESEEEFDVYYYVTPDMELVDNPVNEDLSITQTFTINKNGQSGQVRYSLFKDCGEDDSDLQVQYAMWVYMCISNIAGYEVPLNYVSSFRNEDVKNEFNGDFGCTIFLQNPQSDYGKGFNYMNVEFFYKEKQGLVMRAYLFNDIAFTGINADGTISEDSPWLSNYHIFRFKDNE